MSLLDLGLQQIPHVNNLSTEAFAYLCYPDNPGKLIVPYPESPNNLFTSANNLGLKYNFLSFDINDGSCDDLMFTMHEWLKSGPFILGPLDPTYIWDRIETRYCKGFGHYIFVLGKKHNNIFIVHDPIGCPYFQVSINNIFKAASKCSFPFSLFRIESLSGLHSEEKLYKKIITKGISNRKEILDLPEHNCNGLKVIAERFSNMSIKSSETISLMFAAAEISVLKTQLLDLLTTPPQSIIESNYFNKNNLKKIKDILVRYNIHIAEFIMNIKACDNKQLISSIENIIHLEQNLDECFIDLILE